MKRSIKRQLIVNFACIFIAISLSFVFCDFFLLKNLYALSKYNNIRKAYDLTNLAASDLTPGSQDFLLSFQNICMENNLNGMVFDSDNRLLASLDGAKYVPTAKFDDNPDDSTTEKYLLQKDEYTVILISNQKDPYGVIELKGELTGGERIVLRSSLARIKHAARISNTFILGISMLGVLIGILAIHIVSRRITKPVLELTQISDRMANLDFDAKYEGHGENEIDRLGANMNRVSEKLEKTLEELKKANSELKIDIEKKEEIEMLRREFVANASHELKTPIALIQGYAEGLKEGIIDDPENRNYYCEVIMDEAAKMNELVKQLMNLHELEMGERELHIETFDISEMISNQIQTMSVLAQNNGIEIEYEAKKEMVRSDEFKAEEVFRNYLTNAITHASAGKKVVVTTKETENKLRISVFNTGEPIPEESIEKIWEKFYKVDKARTREYGGSGVGLSIVRATMELLGGDYGVENTEDGVLFYFDLPKEN